MEKYYEAYDKRYRQIHALDLEWASESHTPILDQILDTFHISKDAEILELGCGEGRDAFHLLSQGYDVCATDISPEAVRHCQAKHPEYSSHFSRLNACEDTLDHAFDFIYSVAVIHMLVTDRDRNQFLSFIKSHLKESGIALILTMGNGELERSSGTAGAFDDASRTHQATGREVLVAGTSCRIVSFQTLERELRQNHLEVLETGLTSAEPDFSMMMYAVVR